jgi:6-phosphogluconolactonase
MERGMMGRDLKGAETSGRSRSDLKPDVRIFPDVEALSRAAAQSLADRVRATLTGGGRFHLALAGGNTPRVLYRLLAANYRSLISWPQVHLFWGDERYVPAADSHSNYRMARETLLDGVPIPEENIHPMPTDFPEPEDAARAYEKTLQNFFSSPWPRFDLVLLGLGPDGHTASLFPSSPALEEKERWVVAAQGPVEPRQRLTLTFPVLTHSAQIYFLVAGADKADALRRALGGAPDMKECPAGGVRSGSNAVVWWTDRDAAKLLEEAAHTPRC